MLDEITRLDCDCDASELGFVEREATPEPAMRIGIRSHLAGLSLSNTVRLLNWLGVNRARSTVHNWVQKADLEPQDGRDPATVALDETVIKIDGERFWLYGAVDPEANVILHVSLFASRTTALTKMFLRELSDKHDVGDAEFFVDGAPWLQVGLFELGMHFRHETHGERNPVERVFQEMYVFTPRFRQSVQREFVKSSRWIGRLA